jgi:serine/threonine protein kinase
MTSTSNGWVNILQGQEFGPYTMISYLGGGQFGLVFEAVERHKDKHVAVKILTPTTDPIVTAEFDREGRMLSALKNATNVVDLLGSDNASINFSVDGSTVPIGIRYHVLELADYCLERLLVHREELAWSERIRLWRGVVRGVHQMHLKKMVHRDLKSDNCLIFLLSKNRTECKIGDLGKSRDISEQAIASHEDYIRPRGDLRFAAPELLLLQGRGTLESHKLADLYGLGSILFELVTGQSITTVAVGSGIELMRVASHQSLDTLQIDLSILRPRYSDAYDLFEQSLPPQLRYRAGILLRQLCDPTPQNRLPRTGLGKRVHRTTELEWLIRQADILVRALGPATSTTGPPSRGKRVRHRV